MRRAVRRDRPPRVEPVAVASLTRIPRIPLLVVIAILIVIAELFANSIVAGQEGESSIGGWIGWSLFGIALTAVLLLFAVPQVPGDRRTLFVLGFGIGAVVLCIAYKTAIPFALGAAAITAADPGDDSPHGTGEAPSTAGVLLGALAILAAFVLCIIS
jgi:hypothetical protein